MFATLLGCGLRRSELANLTMKHVQQRDNRWCIVDLVGKHGRVRTIPVPAWVKNAIDAWTVVAAVTEGNLFRPVNPGDQVCGERMSEKVVWQMLKTYVAAAGLPDIAPHDLRRTTAKLCRAAGGSWSRFNCCSATPRFRRRSATSERNRIWRTRRTTGSS
jgi:integrase/recombinase XerD